MQRIFLAVLAIGLFAIPMNADEPVAPSSSSCPALQSFALAEEPLFTPAQPSENENPSANPEVAIPEGAVIITDDSDPELKATAAQVSCPPFVACPGHCAGGNCGYTDTGKRCCYFPDVTPYCCPIGTTVWAVGCPCTGSGCPGISRTATCL